MRKKTSEPIQETIKEAQEAEPDFTEEIVNVGSILKNARKKKGETIDKIANRLRIRSCYLKALEESDYENFPGRAYALGFLRGYAAYLDLDVEELLVKYRKETSFIKPETIDMPISEKPSLFPSVKYLFWAAAIVAFVWIFWYLLTYQETQVENAQPVIVPPEPVVAEEVIEEVKEEAPESVVQKDVVVQKETPTAKTKSKKNAVQLVAREEVWVEIEQDGDLILTRTLKKGETYDVPESKIELFLKTGNAGGLDVFVDGKKVKALGPVGAVRSGISLSAEKLKKR